MDQVTDILSGIYKTVEDRANGYQLVGNVFVFDDTHVFSPTTSANLTYEGKEYMSPAHMIKFCKAFVLNDKRAMSRLTNARTHADVRNVKVVNFTNAPWKRIEPRVYQSVYLVYLSQHEPFRKALINTGKKKLAYASTTDCFFGNGLTMTSENAGYPQFWQGQNALGSILQKLRSTLTL